MLSKGELTKVGDRCWRVVVISILFFFVLYALLYVGRMYKVNRIHERKFVKVSELPPDCARYIETYGLPHDDPEVGRAYVTSCDIDCDGVLELITDAGELGRGAANSWRAIWRRQPTGRFCCIGRFYSDSHCFVPPWYIYGMPSIWCWYDKCGELVRWRAGRYEGRGCLGLIGREE